MKTAIVTGAYGYIGSVLCKLLKEDGYYVVGIDNDPNCQSDWIQGANRVKYCDDFLAADFVSEPAMHVYHEYKDATIFHLAANSLLGPSAIEPLLYFKNNTAKTLNLIRELTPSNKFLSLIHI